MRGENATAPDGIRWQVRRRWLDRPLPDIRRRFKHYREEVHGSGEALEGLWVVDALDSVWVALATVVFIVLVVFVLLPLLGIAVELILLFLLFSSGLVGRVVLRRPWTVEAIPDGARGRTVSYAVKGWRRSGRAVEEIARAIQVTGPPDRIAEGVKVS